MAAETSSVVTETVTAPAPVVVLSVSRMPDWSAASNSLLEVTLTSMVLTETEPSLARVKDETIDLVAA